MALSLAAGVASGLEQRSPDSSPLAWSASPYRNFGAAQSILAGRVLVSDEAENAPLRAALAGELKALAAELHEKQGWRVPFAESDPLRIYIARKEADGVRRLASRAVDRGRLVAPAIQLDATGWNDTQILREAARLYALATISSYGAPDAGGLAEPVAQYLSRINETDDEREAALAAAAAPTVNLAERSASLGRFYVEEYVRAAGAPAALRAIWEKASETGEEVGSLLSKSFVELTGEGPERLVFRFAARLYARYETEPSPSRIGLPDLEDGGLDAAAPAAGSLRHRTYIPAAAPEAGSALRVTWPEGGAPAAAVVRYRDAALPPDVISFAAGQSRAVPLSGVARVDWVVVPAAGAAVADRAPATVEEISDFPYSSLSAHAAGGGGARVWWTTSSHDALMGWAVFREEVLSDGRIARTGPEIVPSSQSAEEPFRYMFVDPATTPGTFYRYTVWAVTEEGALSRAFSATLRTGD